MGKQFENVGSMYGAPMGRSEYIICNPVPSTLRFKLFRVRLDNGGYDDGGAYWGTGAPLYCAEVGFYTGDYQNIYSYLFESHVNPTLEHRDLYYREFFRAGSREEAKAHVLKRYPNAKFYR